MEKRIESFLKGELPEQKKIDELEGRLASTVLSSSTKCQLADVCKLEITRLREAVLNPDEKSRSRAITHLTENVEKIISALK